MRISTIQRVQWRCVRHSQFIKNRHNNLHNRIRTIYQQRPHSTLNRNGVVSSADLMAFVNTARTSQDPSKRQPAPNDLSHLVKTPAQSLMTLDLPFASSEQLRDIYVNFLGQLRMGRFLEDLDAMSGVIAYKHCEDDNPHSDPLTIVTASCDRIDLLGPLEPADMLLRGCCTYVGRSSMNIDVELVQTGPTIKTHEATSAGEPANAFVEDTPKEDQSTFDPRVLLRASFTMVARHPETYKSVPVPWLHPKSRQERMWFEAGRKRQEAIAAKRKASVLKTTPSSEELQLVHNIFLESSRPSNSTDELQAHGIALEPSVPGMFLRKSHGTESEDSTQNTMSRDHIRMKDTELRSVKFTMPQDRNIHNKVFGGLLMRKAFELAFSTAWTYAGQKPLFVSLDDITFNAPVPIGTLLHFSSRVEYTAEHHGQHFASISVSTVAHDPSEGRRTITNGFHFTFKFDCAAPTVVPETYADAMTWLNAHRSFTSGLETSLLLTHDKPRFPNNL